MNLGKKVKFRFAKSGSLQDVYEGITDDNWYLRSPDSRWYVGSKWEGGVEASHPIGKHVLFYVYDDKDKLLFKEKAILGEKKNYPFTWDIGKESKEEIINENNLINDEEWGKHLREAHEKSGIKDYIDNWMYSRTYITIKNQHILKSFEVYNDTFDIICEECEHERANLKWLEYHCKSRMYGNITIIYGYRYIN